MQTASRRVSAGTGRGFNSGFLAENAGFGVYEDVAYRCEKGRGVADGAPRIDLLEGCDGVWKARGRDARNLRQERLPT